MDKYFWRISQLGDALFALTKQLHWKIGEIKIPTASSKVENDREKINERIISLAEIIGIKAEPVMVQYNGIENLLKKAHPAIFLIQKEDQPFLLIVLNSNGETLEVLGNDLVKHKLSISMIRSLYCQDIETPILAEVDELLDYAGIAQREKTKAREILLKERIGKRWIGDCWIIRQSLSESIKERAHQAHVPARAILLVFSYLVYYSLWLFSWWLIGKGVLQGHIDLSWLIAWGLALLTLVPLKMAIRWLQGILSINVGCLLKQKLFHGALSLNPDSIRHQGIGQLMGHVAESEKLETLAINGGFVGLLAVIEIILAAYVLAMGFGGLFHIFMLVAWLAITFLISWSFYRKRKKWTDYRLTMTHNLIERMVGYRTRLVQEAPNQWHESEDQELYNYNEISCQVDRLVISLTSLIPRGWIVLALASFVPILTFRNPSTTSMAVAIGGILLAYKALIKLTSSLNKITGAVIAWRYLKAFFEAASQSEIPKVLNITSADDSTATSDSRSLFYLRDLDFSHVSSSKKVLDGCNLKISSGDRLLLQGPSGGGKSTLVSLLTALRKPNAGFLLLKGLDEKTWGANRWRKQVVAAPQFHENRILTGTFAFNLLMGREWPPTQNDLDEAESLCHELGLGRLLEQMPAGMMQMVGETGWQLSHGEKSRVYIARALLQKAPLIILDESFAALDPETLKGVLKCVEERARTLLVIAHP
jgi:ATP-binding cassette subfamily B protein